LLTGTTTRLATLMLVILVLPALAVAVVPAPLLVLEVAGANARDAGSAQAVPAATSCTAPSGYDDVVPVVLVAAQSRTGLVSATVAKTLAHVARDLCGLTIAFSEVRSPRPTGTPPRTSVVSSARSPANRGCSSPRLVAEDLALRSH
jgi:hypothetical protein